MGYVIGFIALFLIVFAFTDPAKGVPLLILVVGGVIAFFSLDELFRFRRI